MILITILTVLLIIGIVWILSADDNFLAWLFSLCVGIILACVIISIPLSRNDVRRDIQKLEAFRQTINTSRKRGLNDLERVALLKEVAHWNEKLAGAKYNNKHFGDWWVPDEIENVKPIE